MKVYEVMTQEIESISPYASVRDAARTMGASRIGFLPVVNGAHVIGVVTDRDLALRVVAQGLDPSLTQVASVMSPNPVFVYDDQTIEEAVQLMCSQTISRLIVRNRLGFVVGLLSVADLVTLGDMTLADIVGEVLGERYWQSHLLATALTDARP